MKRYFYIIASILLVCLSSCKKDESVSFGTVEYYPDFLWVDSKTTSVSKTFEFDFSQDARNYDSYAEFQFVDNEGKAIGTDIMQIVIDGKECPNNRFRINSDVKSKDLTFKFSPDAMEGKHQGYLKLVSHQLDRLDSQPLTANQQVDAFQWTLNYDKRMNPLAKILMWLFTGIVVLVAVWQFCFRPIIYPRFGSIQKSFIVPGMPPLIVRFKGARMVVLAASHSKKQSAWNRFWTGKVLYKTHPAFGAPIIFKPSRGRRVLSIVQAGSYQVMPNPMPGVGAATIVDIQKNVKINVN